MQSSENTTNDLMMLLKACEKAQLDRRLNLLGVGVQKEINILSLLLKAREAVTNYAFQDTCIALFICKQDLTEWKRLCQAQDFPKECSLERQFRNHPLEVRKLEKVQLGDFRCLEALRK
ncbi:hypothetical protein EC973_009538 [Apophysomyces ossiformis]|uniref:Uncharacterized protein n=1 Tax=Apophysomyces ossiformis TaxID=679940 RepID=A0A8H7EQA9_9FUNG|nr:hypothetical protein EC973_009538 [Apophysomyces ossiformis]